MSKFLRTVVAFPILVYQKLISPFLAPACRYYPSCSHYAREAIFRHGAGKGAVFAVARILRCSPFFDGGYDPVPGIRNWPQLARKIRRDYRHFRSKNTPDF